MESKSTSPLSAKEDLKLVKEYISKCPAVPPTSNAIRVAIAALDQELKRINRDEKLRLKFSSNSGSNLQVNGNDEVLMSVFSDDSMVHVDASVVHVDVDVDVDVDDDDADHMRTQEKSNTSGGNTNSYNTGNNDDDDDAALNEWQDVEAEAEADGSSNMQVDSSESIASSTMGVLLLQIALRDMSNAGTVVSTPTAALALILHSALMSKVLGFKCTGMPDDPCCFKNDVVNEHNNKKQKGFAAPIRELPRGVVLPKMWDAHASLYSHSDITSTTHRVLLRYSKIGMPVIILKVEIVQDDADADARGKQVHSNANVMIKFGPLDGEPFETSFPIDQHVNLEGLQKATLREGRGVQPALHYKALSGLFTDFCNRADLGIVDDGTQGSSTAIGNGPSESDFIAAKYARSSVPIPPKPRDLRPMIDNDLLRINRNHGQSGIMPGGDFADDLLPSGLPLPGFANPYTGGNGVTGNLMGPNHPAFQHQFNNDEDDYLDDSAGFMVPGGLGMQPRFDPYYPSGLGGRSFGGRGMPGRAGRGRGRGRGGRFSSGDPNPDHLRRPNTFGGGDDNMFM